MRGVMSDPVLESAAQAIRDELSSDGVFFTRDDGVGPYECYEGALDTTALARTVLQAIRDPSDAMLTAAAGLTEGEGGPTEMWQTMIDAALADG